MAGNKHCEENLEDQGNITETSCKQDQKYLEDHQQRGQTEVSDQYDYQVSIKKTGYHPHKPEQHFQVH